MKSKTKIEKQTRNKSNSELVATIITAKKSNEWLQVAQMLSGPRRNRVSLNLDYINKTAKDGETIIVPGKVLSQGEIDKKIKIVALNFSEKAKEKLLKSKTQAIILLDEIKKNPRAKGVRILTNSR